MIEKRTIATASMRQCACTARPSPTARRFLQAEVKPKCEWKRVKPNATPRSKVVRLLAPWSAADAASSPAMDRAQLASTSHCGPASACCCDGSTSIARVPGIDPVSFDRRVRHVHCGDCVSCA
eukprot:6621605-Prymnesium_polylepis.2